MDAISNRSLKARVGALAVSLVMATAIATPALAFADGTTSQSTDVTIQSVTPDPDGDNLSFSVPTQIPFVAKADGTMLAPSADTLQIQNKSVFPIHVVNMAVTEQSPFKLVSDVTVGTTANAFQFRSTACRPPRPPILLSMRRGTWAMPIPQTTRSPSTSPTRRSRA